MIIKKIITILSRAVGLIFYCLCLYLFNKNYGDGIRAERFNLLQWKNRTNTYILYLKNISSYDKIKSGKHSRQEWQPPESVIPVLRNT